MKYVYSFSEGNKDMRELLGGKGANLAEMTNIGLPVPKGFTITTEACNNYYKNNDNIDNNIVNEILLNISKLEYEIGDLKYQYNILKNRHDELVNRITKIENSRSYKLYVKISKILKKLRIKK